jgi:hypothetical protein
MHKRMIAALLAAFGFGELASAQSPNLPNVPLLQAQPTLEQGNGTSQGIFPEPVADSLTRWWTTVDIMAAWMHSVNLPPLVTSSTIGTPQAAAGVMGIGTTNVQFGNYDVGDGTRPGIRLGAGGWLDDERTLGIEASFFVLGSLDAIYQASSAAGNPILARPFFNTVTKAQDSQLIAYPGQSGGSVYASVRTGNFYSLNIDFSEEMLARGNVRLDALAGYRYLRYDDRLTIDQTITSLGSGAVAAGTQFVSADSFTAHNSFNGGEVGMRIYWLGDNWVVDLTGRIALGNVHRAVGILGGTQVTAPGSAPIQEQGGVLALASNMGTYGSNDFVVAPSAELNFSYDLTDHISLHIGYSFLLWTDVARASNQVDLNVNPNLLPPAIAGATPANPTFNLQKTDISVQAVSAGLELRF